MPIAAWPSWISFVDLPQSFREQGPQDNVIRTKMEHGPVKARRRFTAASRTMSGQTGILTQAEFDQFESWYDDTIMSGSLPFTATNPRSGAVRTFRFVSTYDVIYEHDNMYRVDMKLEQLP